MNIEKVTDKKQIKEELIKENAEFNMETIFIDEEYEGAMIFVTPNQTVKSYVGESHERIAKLMYQTIYGEKLESYDNKMWQQVLTDEGIICMQICRDGYQIIFLPKNIATQQYNMMQEIMGKFDRISCKIIEEGKSPLKYMLAMSRGDGELDGEELPIEKVMERAANITTSTIKAKNKEELLEVNKNGIGSLARSARHYRKGAKEILRGMSERNKEGINDR